MKEVLRIYWFLLFLFLVGGIAHGQAEDHEFGLPLYWDANTDGVTVTYGAYSSPSSCTDPSPSPANCVAFSKVADVPHTPDPVCTPDCIV